MKKTIIVLIALGISVLASSKNNKQNASTVNFTVSVSEIPSIDGNVYILLYNQPIGFPTNPDKAYRKVWAKVTASNQVISISNMPIGKYSAVVFHDKNANKKMDKGWFGSPKESYGFSNIPNAFCGVPSFEQTAFNVGENATSIKIKLMVVK